MSQRRRSPQTLSRARRRRQNRRYAMVAGGAILLIVIIIVLIVVFTGRRPDPQSVPVAAATASPSAETSTPQPTLEPTATPQPTADPWEAVRPKADAGWLPIFASANTEEKVIAITVDDCYQAENLRQIVDKAIECGGKLTIFPIGSNVLRDPHSEILRYAWENGFELENHTYSHNGLYGCTDEQLAQEVYLQNLALSSILGQEYHAHFLRPKGGDARRDQRMHAYAEQMGYYGIAHWSVSGSGSSARQLVDSLKPGAIYLFHTTDKDLEKLLGFIPYATAQGYRLVTLNEMFGYPENETSALTVPIEQHQIPPLEKYDVVYVTYKKGSYAYGVLRLQQKLIELGYLTGNADGIYGDATVEAVKRYQSEHGLSANGEADAALQEQILGPASAL